MESQRMSRWTKRVGRAKSNIPGRQNYGMRLETPQGMCESVWLGARREEWGGM